MDDFLEEGALIGDPTGKRWRVRLIKGDFQGSSGYYPADMLKTYGPQVFKKGTPMFLDHQTAEEKQNKPFGSINNYAGELLEDAYYENDGLYAEIQVFDHEQQRIKALKDRIGLSIRAKGNRVNKMVNGKSIPVVEDLVSASSVDFVMRAGAGGALVDMLESATNSDEISEIQEEGQNMDEVAELLKGLTSAVAEQSKSIKDLAESLKAESVEESKTPDVNPLEVAKTLAASELSEDATARVLERFQMLNGEKTLDELIESEKSYLAANKVASTEGIVEDEESLEESAKDDDTAWTIPSRWAVKGTN